MWHSRLTDQQFINRLKAGRRWRRQKGIFLTAIGLLQFIFAAYLIWRFQSLLTPILNPLPPKGTPDTAASALVNYTLGFSHGLALASLLFGGLFLVLGAFFIMMNGLFLAGPDRKTELLLQCWRERPGG